MTASPAVAGVDEELVDVERPGQLVTRGAHGVDHVAQGRLGLFDQRDRQQPCLASIALPSHLVYREAGWMIGDWHGNSTVHAARSYGGRGTVQA